MELRPMVEADVDAGLRLCRAAGWNQLAADWRCFLKSSPAGCLAAECGGEVIGTAATLGFERRFGWVSMVLVTPEWRGRGIGSLLFRKALDLLGDMETIRLDATPAGKQVYDKFGFGEEYGIVRLRANAGAAGAQAERGSVRALSQAELAGIREFDRGVFGADRGAVLDHLFSNAPEYASVAETNGSIRGFAMGRHGYLAEHIGPIVAEDEATARALAAVALRVPARPVIVDAPLHSTSWRKYLAGLGFAEERLFVRMFRGSNAHPGRPCRQFAIAGPEFG